MPDVTFFHYVGTNHVSQFPIQSFFIHDVADLQKDRNRERRSKPLRKNDGVFEDRQASWRFDRNIQIGVRSCKPHTDHNFLNTNA